MRLLDPRKSLLVAALLAAPASSQALGVASHSPIANALDAGTASVVRVTFDQPLDPTTAVAANVMVFGRWSGVVPGGVGLSPDGLVLEFDPARPYFAGETVSVMLSEGIKSATGVALDAGFTWQFWARPAAGSGSLVLSGIQSVRRPSEGWVQAYGAYAGDLDEDGSPDLAVINEAVADVRVLLNDGCGTFPTMSGYPLTGALTPSPNEGQDFDGDGHIDLAVANIGADTVSILFGDGQGGFLPHVQYPSGSKPRGLTVLDLEGDGDPDIATANRGSSDVALLANRGDGTFDPAVFVEAGGSTETSIFAVDADADGISDLFVGHFGSKDVTLLIGDGSGGFSVTATQSVGGSPWMLMGGDVDGDGNADAATCNFDSGTAAIVRGTGAGGLHPASFVPAGTFPLAIDLGDLEGDGDLDLMVSNYGSSDFTYLVNDGAGGFGAPTSFPATSAGSCALFVDYDRDGDLDVVAIDELADELRFLEHVETPPAGVQPRACEATLRVNNLAGAAGFGGSAPRPVQLGATAFLGFTGVPSVACTYGIGVALEPGLALVVGLLNVLPPTVLGSVTTDAFGEALVPVTVSSGLPAGATVALQGYAVDPGGSAGARLTNPEVVVFVP
jgi:hypothetical protein